MRLDMKIATAAAVLAVAAGACGGRTQTLGSRYVKKAQVTTAHGGSLSVTQGDDAALAGTAISVPAGAVGSDVTITVAPSDEPVVDATATAAGPVAEFGPDGLVFAKPATVTLPFTLPAGQSADALVVFAVESSGQVVRVERRDLAVSGATVSFAVNGFTRFGAALRKTGSGCSTDADCPPNELCMAGACSGAADGGPAPDGGPAYCRLDSDCAAGQVCMNGMCTVAMDGGGGPMDAGVMIDAGSSCASNLDCPAGEVCTNGACTMAMDAGPAPADGGVVYCRTNADCPANQTCDPSTGTCI